MGKEKVYRGRYHGCGCSTTEIKYGFTKPTKKNVAKDDLVVAVNSETGKARLWSVVEVNKGGVVVFGCLGRRKGWDKIPYDEAIIIPQGDRRKQEILVGEKALGILGVIVTEAPDGRREREYRANMQK